MSVSQEFWRDKRVFLTGHTGFKGAWLSLWLQELGATVKGYALAPPTEPALFELADVARGMESDIGDIRNFDSLSQSLAVFDPEILIHMAAQPLVRRSYDEPLETFATNVMGTAHILEAARRCSALKAVVNVTTDKCYENKEWFWGYRESDPMGGHDPYSSSKGCAELVTAAYRRSFFCAQGAAVASARAGNVIGGGDWAQDRLLPDALRSFQHERPVLVRNPSATRPWQHVLEPLSGYLRLAEKLYVDGVRWAEAWNFGPRDDDVKSVGWVLDYLVEGWGRSASWTVETRQQPHEAQLLKLDISKAKNCLGWNPQWSLELALDKVIDWHKCWLAGEDMRKHTIGQINSYTATSNR